MLRMPRGALVLAVAFLLPAFLPAQTIAITPANPSVGVGATRQLTAQATGLSSSAVTWMVAGIPSGNPTVGTIDSSGLYKAPAAPPGQNPVLITAVSSLNGTTTGSTYALILTAGPTITSVTPNPLPTGTVTVTIQGSGFLPGATVLKGGDQWSTSAVTATSVTATGYQGPGTSVAFSVRNPSSVSSNSLTVPVGAGAPTNTSIAITPATPSVGVGATVQYTAQATGLSSSGVTWSVGGVPSGNSTVGTITAAGLYKAPAVPPGQNPVTITAISTVDGKTTGTAYAYILNAGPMITAVTPNPLPAGTITVTIQGSGFQPGAMIYNGNVQLSSTGVTASTVSGTGYQGPATSTTFCVRNPTSVCSNYLTVSVSGSSNSGGGGSGGGNPAKPVISPSAATVILGGTQQFSASNVTGWTATAGSITSGGLYTAPVVMPASGSDTITATGPGGQGTATVTLVSNTPPSIQSVNLPSLPLGVFTITVNGSGFIAQSVVKLNGAALTTSLNGATLTASGFAGTPGAGSLTVVNGPLSSQPYVVQIGVQNPVVSAAAARRFLEQAAFGPTPAEADHVQAIGFQGWLNEQFAKPVISNYNGLGSQSGMPAYFLANAVTNADQLRQRVAFALSEIFVTSITKVIWNSTMIPYQQMLMADAFTNYRQILQDVTLSPAMGYYLDMANNAKANPAAGTVANENYAREVLQLFSLGTNLLNPDGSVQTDATNLPLPTYSQFTITEFARVFTGWTNAPAQAGGQIIFPSYINPNAQMVPWAPQHDSGAKTLLNGYVSPAGISAQQDLQNALDNIAGHANVAPFISRQLIQHLVKSNPSPQYVQRVASAFSTSSGDMKTVITAILLDPEARANDAGGSDQPSDGHLQEPALFLPALVRAFGGQMTTQNYFSSDMAAMGQDIYNPASVFNYFSPGYMVAGTGLRGPEFQIDNPNAAIVRENMVANLFSAYSNPIQTYGPGTTVDLTPFLALASTPSTLMDAIDLTLTHGTMPAAMKQTIVNAITADTGGNLRRVQTGIYLTLTSSYYNVWH